MSFVFGRLRYALSVALSVWQSLADFKSPLTDAASREAGLVAPLALNSLKLFHGAVEVLAGALGGIVLQHAREKDRVIGCLGMPPRFS